MSNAWKASPLVLKMFDSFQDVTDLEMAEIAGKSELREYKQGQTLIHQGRSSDWVFYILAGVVKLSRRINASNYDEASQTEVVVQIFGQGDAIGDTSIFFDFEYKGTIRAVTDCEVLAVNRNSLGELALRNQSVLLSLYNRTSRKFLRVVEGVDLSYGTLLERIEILADAYRNAGIDLYRHFSKAEIARMLGVSRVAVSQSLNGDKRYEKSTP